MGNLKMAGIVAAAVFCMLGCTNAHDLKPTVTIQTPGYFIQKLEYDTPYVVPDDTGKGTTTIIVRYTQTGKMTKEGFHIAYGKDREFYSDFVLRQENRVPYFVHSRYGNIMYLYDPQPSKITHSSIWYFSLQSNYPGTGNTYQVGLLGEPKDPAKVAVVMGGGGVGTFVTERAVEVTERGQPRLIPPKDGYIYALPQYNEKLTLKINHEFDVFPSKQASSSTRVTLPAGTVMTHWRIHDGDGTEDLLLEDGRFVRVRCHAFFSEPYPYYEADGMAAKGLFTGVRDH